MTTGAFWLLGKKILFQEFSYQLFVDFSVGLVTHGKVDPCLFVHNTLVMGEGIESLFSVIGSHSAFSESAESHLCGRQMDNGVVDASAAVIASGSDLFGSFFV